MGISNRQHSIKGGGIPQKIDRQLSGNERGIIRIFKTRLGDIR